MRKIILGSIMALSLITPKPNNLNVSFCNETPIAGLSKVLSNTDTEKLLQMKNGKTASGSAIECKVLKKTKIGFKKIAKSKRNYYTTCAVNFRKKPNLRKKYVIKVLYSYKEVKVIGKNKEWYKVKVDGKLGYIKKEYLKRGNKVKKKVISVPVKNTSFKSWMPYEAITCVSSPQYKFQQNEAYTGQYGIRQVDGRFCAALGSYFETKIGVPFDIVMKNGTIIPCILADQKANKDTNNINTTAKQDSSMIEFIVSKKHLKRSAINTGNIGSCNTNWYGDIEKVIKYID